MNKRKKLRSVSVPLILFSLAIGLLGFSAVGSTRAALTYYSETYTAQIDVKSIGVTLIENDQPVSCRDYLHADDRWSEQTGELLSAIPAEEEWQPGRLYDERLSVKNSGTIDEYVRVKIYKYWLGEDGKKRTDLSPSLIDLRLTGGGWIVDEKATTAKLRDGDERDGEMIVLYYNSVLKSGGTTPLFADGIAIDGSIAAKVKETVTTNADGWTNITTVYEYDGASFMLEAEVDAVQTHNAQSAIKSAWGVDVTVGADGSLTLRP